MEEEMQEDYDPRNLPIMWYRLGWKDRMKDWSKEKKDEVIREISDISLERNITTPDTETKFKLESVPSVEFTGLQLYAGMIELSQDLGMPIRHATDSMVEALARRKKKQLKEEVLGEGRIYWGDMNDRRIY